MKWSNKWSKMWSEVFFLNCIMCFCYLICFQLLKSIPSILNKLLDIQSEQLVNYQIETSLVLFHPAGGTQTDTHILTNRQYQPRGRLSEKFSPDRIWEWFLDWSPTHLMVAAWGNTSHLFIHLTIKSCDISQPA